jgi:hypothetical protein
MEFDDPLMELPELIDELPAGVLVFFVFDFALVGDDMEFDPDIELDEDIEFEPDIVFEPAAGVDCAKAVPVSTAEIIMAGTINFKERIMDLPGTRLLPDAGGTFSISATTAKGEKARITGIR